MPRFAANVTMLFGERPFLERFRAAADAGFAAVEMQFPYEYAAEEIAAAREAAGVEVVLFNLPAGDLMTGGPGLAAMPERADAFAAALETGLAYAEVLRPRCVNVLAGAPPPEADSEACLETLATNLRRAAEALAPLGVTVTTEAINTESRPGFLLSTAAQVMAVLNLAEHPNLAMQFDIYHAAIMEDHIAAVLETHIDRIGHIQFADHPGRGEPGTGRLDLDALFTLIDRLNYAGWVGAEYKPSRRTEETLQWLERWK